jgi:hypothetical protein
MSRWYRVFGAGEVQPHPDALLEHLRELGVTGPAHFRGDEQGWTSLEFVLAEGSSTLLLSCYLASESDIRHELNTWAAWLETCDYSRNHELLMERAIQTKQLYTLRRPQDQTDEARLDRICKSLCRYLAQVTDGVYQCDQHGFFGPDGALLLQEV